MDPITALGTEVENTEGVEESAAVLLAGLAGYIEAHKTDPVAIQAYADRMRASSTKLAAAVAANPLPQ